MRTSATIIALACLIATLANGAVVAANDPDRLYGVWNVKRLERNGNPTKDGDGGSFIFQKGSGTLMGLAGEYQLNELAEPKELDFNVKYGGKLRGIYKIDGNTVTVCLAMSDTTPRPTGFSTQSNDGRELIVLNYARPPINWLLLIGATTVVVAAAAAGWSGFGRRRKTKSKPDHN